jgi:FdhD protein
MPATPLGPVPGLGYADLVSSRAYLRLGDEPASTSSAHVAEEVPIALVYNAQPLVVVMSSPADLEDLAIGFSITEQVVDAAADVSTIDVIRHSRGIELHMTIPEEAADRLAARRRAMSARTGCGVCGVQTIDEVLRAPAPVRSTARFDRSALWTAAEMLERQQPINAETRAVHAAGFSDRSGNLRIVREDVGRHNALDKVVGAMARSGAEAGQGFLIATSRASYELVLKTAVAGVPLLAAISRPTGLAIELAERANVTLVGLLRGRSANVYSHQERFASE